MILMTVLFLYPLLNIQMNQRKKRFPFLILLKTLLFLKKKLAMEFSKNYLLLIMKQERRVN